jgi:carboxyl-terminal processing protease
LKKFKLSEKEYQEFLAWTKEQKFYYTTPLERSTKDLIEAAKTERFYPEVEAELNRLKIKIESNKDSDLIRFKPEISQLLEEQIAFHYSLIEGQAEVSMTHDAEIMEAKKVLLDQASYKNILSPQEWH